MMRLFIVLLSIFFCIRIGAQGTYSKGVLDQVETLISQKKYIEADRILLQIDKSVIANESSETKARYYFLLGLSQFDQGIYEKAINELLLSLNEQDLTQKWDCENYLRTAYLISSSYFNLKKYEESKEVINNSLIKCARIWDTCIYSKLMYQLLVIIHEKLEGSPFAIEQIHNEIQLIAINLYASNPHNKDGAEIKDRFMYWYNKLIDRSNIKKNDSLYMEVAFSKAAYLRSVKEFDESIRLNEIIRQNTDEDDENIFTIYDSLLQMYAETSNKDSIESILSAIYSYSDKHNLGKDTFTECMVVAHILLNKGDYNLSQMYYERVNNYLNQNKDIDDWKSKKETVLSWLIWNYRSLGKYNEILGCCEEYEKLSESLNYEEICFIKYQEGYALLGLENYERAIHVLNDLVMATKEQRQEKTEENVRANQLLGICYSKTDDSTKSIERLITALETYTSINMDDESVLASLYYTLGKEYHKQNQSAKALPYLEKSAAIQNKIFGETNEYTKQLIEECKK